MERKKKQGREMREREPLNFFIIFLHLSPSFLPWKTKQRDIYISLLSFPFGFSLLLFLLNKSFFPLLSPPFNPPPTPPPRGERGQENNNPPPSSSPPLGGLGGGERGGEERKETFI